MDILLDGPSPTPCTLGAHHVSTHAVGHRPLEPLSGLYADQNYRAQLLLTEPSWAAALASEFSKPYFRKLEAFLEAEAKTCNIFPAPENIFR